MKQLLLFSLFAVIICACGADEAGESASGTSAADPEAKPAKWKRNSKQREPKWVIAVDGLPELSGITVSAVGSIDGTRVELLGEVECSPTSGDKKSERRRAQINGWFETKK